MGQAGMSTNQNRRRLRARLSCVDSDGARLAAPGDGRDGDRARGSALGNSRGGGTLDRAGAVPVGRSPLCVSPNLDMESRAERGGAMSGARQHAMSHLESGVAAVQVSQTKAPVLYWPTTDEMRACELKTYDR